MVGEAAFPPRGQHPQGCGQQHRDRGRSGHELEGGRQALQHEAGCGLALPERLAEVAGGQARDEVPVLHGEGPVQTQGGPALGPVLLGGFQRQRHRGRVGEDVGDHEHQGSDDEDDQRGGDDASGEPPKQRAPSCPGQDWPGCRAALFTVAGSCQSLRIRPREPEEVQSITVCVAFGWIY